jgi:hypothetical protein
LVFWGATNLLGSFGDARASTGGPGVKESSATSTLHRT